MIPVNSDFCGLSATFKLQGQLIPIPEYWIPQALLEWGQAPTSLETIVSENDATQQQQQQQQQQQHFTRQVLTILPAIGCAVDNQEVIKTVEEIDCIQQLHSNHASVVFGKVSLPNHNNRLLFQLEASFGLPDQHRARIRVQLEATENNKDASNVLQLVDPVRIVLERQVSHESSQGTMADGGGMDGQRVSKMRGAWLSRQMNFATTTGIKQTLQLPEGTVVFPGNFTLSSHVTSEGNFLQVDLGRFPDDGHKYRQIIRATIGPDGGSCEMEELLEQLSSS